MFNISIKAKLYTLLAVVMAILLTSSIITYRAISPIQEEWDFYLGNVAERQILLMDIKAQFGYGGTIHNFKNYVLRGKAKYYDRLDGNFTKLSLAISNYLELADLTSDEKQALQNIKSVMENYKAQTGIAYKLINQGKTPEAVDAIVKVNDDPAFKAFAVLDAAYKQLTGEASVALTENIDGTISSTVLGSILLVIFVSVSIFLLTQVITRRLGNVQQTLHDIESFNDIGMRLETNKNDEISDVFNSLNKLLESFSLMIRDIIKASVDVGIESANQAAIVEQTVKGVHQQHEKIALVTSSMKQMSETVQNVSTNAEQAVNAAQVATQGVETGSQQMSQMIQTMNQLNNRIDTASQTISQLEQESQQISSVLQVIHGISEQTNLLALNAAIEAARAGEQGRGFAVVADEVRALAARTRDSTDEIRAMIERLQHQVQSAVKVMDDSRQSTKESSEQATQTGDTLDKVSNDIGNMSHAMSQIAVTSAEQFQVSIEMGEHFNAIQAQADNTAQLADSTLVATGHIGEKTELLRFEATKFKIDDTISQLEQAKAAHLAWRSKLSSYLGGKQNIDSKELYSHKDCILGQWYYSEGLKNFAHIPEMQELEPPHEEIHRVIYDVVELKRSGNDEKAMEIFEKITPLSQQIVEIIDRIIMKV
ncbi:MAG: methyl-accepting chemotaxis protein [Gammaproteobacteria bacterium]|nr:methyl-accepting chemotaxis protein [Gammaproteobacteria bacterium]